MKTTLQPWSVPYTATITALNTTDIGLKEEEVEVRLSLYGNNTFHQKEKVKAFYLFLRQFVNPLIFLLVGAAILTSILGEWVNTIVISFAVFLNVFLGFYHEYHAENTLSKLTTYIKDRARVIRNGVEQEIDSSLLVPGDIIKLSYGTRVPADARIITENNLRTDESVLTGESLPVEKNENILPLTAEITERSNIAHAGTLVVEGYGRAIVYATGGSTEIGKIAGLVSKIDRAKTPLQRGIDYLAWRIFFVVIVIVIGILILGIIRGESFIPMLVLSTAVAVGAVPEGLPIVLTVILAIGAERILSKRGVIKKFAAAETLGSATLIMTDKTGTLTQADMQLVGVYSKESLLSNNSYTKEQEVFSALEKQLLEFSLLNVDVSIENPNADKKDWIFRGRPFEVNIVKACRKHGVSLDKITGAYASLVLPFNSTNKFSVAKRDGEYVVMGAPDILLKRANLSKEEYLQLESRIESISQEGKRIIGIGTFSE
jgi:Ca2+-transporting ATPase